jgi:glycosyltransferase involved in cell wall biosynthesis
MGKNYNKFYKNNFSITNERKHVVLNLLGIRIKFRKKHGDLHRENIIKNNQNISFDYNKSNKNILFIASEILQYEGVGTRLAKIAKLLAKNGYNVHILTEFNHNSDLLEYNNYYLNFYANNFEQCLLDIIEKYNIAVAEFQFKEFSYMKHFNLDNIKKKCKVGCVIHNLGQFNWKILKKFDYRITISKGFKDYYSKHISISTVVPNGINSEPAIWNYCGQKKL